MIFVADMRRLERPGGTLANIAAGVFCLVYVGLMCTFAVQMRIFWGVGAWAWIVTVKMGDIGAYTVGRLIGRTKMSPTISPGKTMEGAAGGDCLRLHRRVDQLSRHRTARPAEHSDPRLAHGFGWLVFGVLLGGAGIVGDLAESLLSVILWVARTLAPGCPALAACWTSSIRCCSPRLSPGFAGALGIVGSGQGM